MSGGKYYDQHLRVIGQALETKRINVFKLKSDGDRYVVHGTPEKDPSLRAKLRDWRERIRGHPPASSLSYSMPDIDRLEREARSKRAKADRLPDFYSLSNTLRTLGSYLDSKGADLLEIHKRPLTVTILYQDKDGHPGVEERSIASFYNLFVNLHGQRVRNANR